jgi:hypothetical protein
MLLRPGGSASHKSTGLKHLLIGEDVERRGFRLAGSMIVCTCLRSVRSVAACSLPARRAAVRLVVAEIVPAAAGGLLASMR